MDPFSGAFGEDVTEFLRVFEELAVLKSWDDQKQKIAISLYLQDAAAAFYRTIRSQCGTFPEIAEKLRVEFAGQTNHVASFFSLRQSDESPIAYYYKLLELAEKAKMTDDNVIIMQYLKSIRPRYREKLENMIYKNRDDLKYGIIQFQRLHESPTHTAIELHKNAAHEGHQCIVRDAIDVRGGGEMFAQRTTEGAANRTYERVRPTYRPAEQNTSTTNYNLRTRAPMTTQGYQPRRQPSNPATDRGAIHPNAQGRRA